VRVLNRDESDDASLLQEAGAFGRIAVVRAQVARNRRRAAGERDDDLALEILTGEIVELHFGHGQAIPGEHERRFD
jgi:hypothetical protein